MREFMGYPVVDLTTIDEVLTELGLKPWPLEAEMPMVEYMAQASEADRTVAERFGPQVKVRQYRKPDGSRYDGFLTVARPWASVLAVLPDDLVPVVAEFKHGANTVTFALPSGVPSKAEMAGTDPYSVCAKREFEEETGFELRRVVNVGGAEHISGRQQDGQFYPFVGIVAEPVERKPCRLDADENLRVVLFRVQDWLEYLHDGKDVEASAVSTTMLALWWIRRLRLLRP